jgi:hypothetical protein
MTRSGPSLLQQNYHKQVIIVVDICAKTGVRPFYDLPSLLTGDGRKKCLPDSLVKNTPLCDLILTFGHLISL